MVSAGLIIDVVERLLNRRKCKLLLAAEAAMPRDQFKGFRKQVLNEFGNSGFHRDLQDELRNLLKDRQG